jgi:hypothetical protein
VIHVAATHELGVWAWRISRLAMVGKRARRAASGNGTVIA